ncbi:tRNA lysidine(34) synthetase TilS [Sphingobium sp. AN641]|uniref:tRNA lysidine(34) synthetase TilS n=1 Tax=Sphingobium sp. AN641 TaxID=3133443 RepID=UPI0030BE1E85
MTDSVEARFREAMALLPDERATRLGVAVSGGPDSMALLALAARCYPGRVAAATVDHGLRAEAADEAAMVAQWCAAHGVPHATLRPSAPVKGNVQAWARTVRYALLEGWRAEHGIAYILTAHHADDQLETMIMRLNRGSGIAGLAGVRRRSGPVFRPLLGMRKAQLLAYAKDAGLPHVDDPSNADLRFDRAALRARLAAADWLDPQAASRSACALAEAEEALIWMVRTVAERHVTQQGSAVRLDRTDFPREILRRLLIMMIGIADPLAPPPRGDALDRLVACAMAGGKASIGNHLIIGGEHWTLVPAPPRTTS